MNNPPHQRHDPSGRPGSSSSDTSSTGFGEPVPKRSAYPAGRARVMSPAAASANASNTSLPNFSRPSAPFMPQNDGPAPRKASSPLAPPGHRRQHSQGFFEPSLPTASLSSDPSPAAMTNLTASQIAAQAAMQHQSNSQHTRKRSQTVPSPQDGPAVTGKRKSNRETPPPLQLGNQSHHAQQYQNGIIGGHVLAATTAANVAFPRSPATSSDSAVEKEAKPKGEKSKMKLFSKPKHIGISRDKDGEKRERALPSPNKLGISSSGLSRMVSANSSVVSLADTVPSTNSSMYNLSNASASTVVPADRNERDGEKVKDKEKEKHKHHFLSRKNLKLKDKDDHFHLPLSSASSNSKPLDPSAPQSLYSFAPSSPGPTSTTFGKSVSGLDLRHGGRALREKKKEEKASAAAAMEPSIRDGDSLDWPTPAASTTQVNYLAPSSLGSSAPLHAGDIAIRDALSGFGLHDMTPDDAWYFLKAKLLVVFEGEEVRIAVEDLNKLVSVHIQRCVQKHMPGTIVEDLRDLLDTGFASINQSMVSVSEDRLVPHLVQMWLFLFGTILPFIQAVFLPLDLEFKGRGSVMTSREAKEFWGAYPTAESSDISLGDELDVRTIVLLAFRDNVILSRYDVLKGLFSRLSLESINIGVSTTSNSGSGSGGRPSTAASLDPGFGSFNSQSSNALNNVSSLSSDSVPRSRSRAASNTSSNPEQLLFQSFSSPSQHPMMSIRPLQPPDTSHVITETVARMLQCISVLTSVQSGDEAQEKIEGLSKALKHNWLGRARTGRDRRGFVGTRVRPSIPSPIQGEDYDPTTKSADGVSDGFQGTSWGTKSSGMGVSVLG